MEMRDRNSLHVPGVAFFKTLHDGDEPLFSFLGNPLRFNLLQNLYRSGLRYRFDNRSPKNERRGQAS